MKVNVVTSALLEGLNLAASAAASRTPKPVLQGVLITAQKDQLLLMATDLEIGIRHQIRQAEVLSTGQVLVPVAKLLQIIRECADETIVLELVKNALHITGSDSHFQMFTGDAKDFPAIPEFEGQGDFELTAELLRSIIDRTLFAAAKESTRYAIDGLLWDRKGQLLRVVATDGRRLAVATCPLNRAAGPDAKVIIPSKAMSLFQRVITDPDVTFQVKFLSNQVLLHATHTTVSSVLVEGHFPPYEDVIPQDCNRHMHANIAQFASGVRRAALLTSDESKAIRLSFTDQEVTMTGRSPEQGEGSVRVAVRYDGEPLEIGFNPQFLLDVMKVLGGDEVYWELKEANRPGIFREGENYLYVVMPVNLS
ncbi:MAG: Beta sliding clamp [Phycisphaerae bacterium]|nr:Beta sliding clamp [Phycisphaerae bacterium]